MSSLGLNKIIKFAVFFLIGFCFVLSWWWVLNNNFYTNFDISRDLILWHEIIHHNPITLIGPHSGTIPGLFHGPLWYYLNLPALLIGNGNPVALGWFWMILSGVFLYLVFFTASRIFDWKTAILSILILSTNSITNFTDDEKYFYNPYGAVILVPVFFYLFQKYIKSLKPIYLQLSVLIVGLIIQFQMAFGVPIFILTSIYLTIYNFRKNKLYHLLNLLLIVLPLSTFIIFELKNNFLQARTLLLYLATENTQMNFGNFIFSRIDQLFMDNFRMLAEYSLPLQVLFSLSFFVLLFYELRKNHFSYSDPFWLFGYFYFGFGIITFLFKGEIVNYYWPFLPLMVIIFSALLMNISKRVAAVIIFILVGYNLLLGLRIVTDYPYDTEKQDFTSWNYNLEMAQIVYDDSDEDFGYFIYTPNLFGYSQRYAMEYKAAEYKQIESFAFIKKPVTYLIIADSDTGRVDLNPDNWKNADVKINSKPEKILQFKHYRIEKYRLSEEEINNQPNPSLLLLSNGFFR